MPEIARKANLNTPMVPGRIDHKYNEIIVVISLIIFILFVSKDSLTIFYSLACTKSTDGHGFVAFGRPGTGYLFITKK